MSAHSTSRRAYTIPQRRGGDQDVEPRGLGDLDYGNWQLVLLFRAQGGFGSPSKQAPFRVTMVPKTEVDSFDEHLQNLILGSDSDSVAYIHLPKQLPLEEGAAEVLQWFSSTCKEHGTGDCPITDSGAQLALPSSLSPEERKRWHQIARTAGLYSSSRGLRENRRLLVHASAAESNEQWQRRDLKAQAQAREAHELLCEAHGGHSSYSVSELEEMIVSGVDLPPEILTQKTIKSAAADLWEALDAGRAGRAIKLLQETEFPRELACRRNAERSSYPMHAAVSGNMPDVAIELANPSRYAGVFTQRDSSGKTALGLACAIRQVDLVIAFMNAGARDMGGDIDALHRNLIRTGDHASRRLLNSCPYTTAFRRKKLNGAQGGSGKPMDENMSRRDTSSRRQAQLRKDGSRKSREQEKDSSQSMEACTEESSAQSEVPKEATRRRLAPTGVNSLKALLQQNAATLASSPSPSSRMSDTREAKQGEQPVPRVRRGRGRFQGSEEAAAGDASEVVLRHHPREPKGVAREPAGDEGSHTAVPSPGMDAEDHTAQSHVSGNSPGVPHIQEARHGHATVAQTQHVSVHMPSIPEQHVQATTMPQNASGMQQVPAGAEGLVHQGGATFSGVPVAEGTHASPQYNASAQMQHTTLAPVHADGSVQAQHQQYAPATGNYAYVTTPGAAPGTATVAPVGQAPGQIMYVLVTGSDGGQYLLPVMEAQVA